MNNQHDSQQIPPNSVPPNYPGNLSPQDDEINLLDLWKVLVEHKKIVYLFTTLVTFTALIYSLLATPIYRAEALLAPVEEKSSDLGILGGQFSGLASLAGVNLNNRQSRVEEAIAILKSRQFTYKFIRDEKLLPILFTQRWDKNTNKWRDNRPPTLEKAYRKFNSIRTMSQDRKTGLYTLSIEWRDPVLAAKWVGDLVERLNTKLRKTAISDSENSIEYLQAELQKTGVIEIKESIYSLIEAQMKNKMLANSQEEYAFRVLDRAVVPEGKIKPKRTLIVLIGFALGLVFSVIVAFARHFYVSIRK